jgi:cytochrome c2
VLSRPIPAMLWGLPFPARRAVGGWSKSDPVQRAWRSITRPASAWCLHAAALWAWHAPALFSATLTNEWVHAAQHLSFFLTALLFWWSFLSRREWGPGVVSIFTTAVHTSILGALLTFSPRVLYTAYQATAPLWGFSALEDQQIGGLIMWVPAGVIYMVAGLAMFWRWVQRSGAVATVLACVFLAGCSMQAGNPIVPGGDPHRGPAAIAKYGCGACHTIGGIPGAHGLVGPELTGLRNRMYIGGVLANTPENLRDWIQKPKEINPRTAMPQLGVSRQDAQDIAAYVYTIR